MNHMELLNIITDVQNTEDLELVEESILLARGDLPIEICWHLLTNDIWDSKKIETRMISRKKTLADTINECLDQIETGFVYFLSSNNLMHPGLLPKFLELKTDNWDGLVCQQILEDNIIREIRIAASCIDASQFLVSRKAIAEVRWHNIDGAEGYFLDTICDKNSIILSRVGEPLCYYNKKVEYELLMAAPKTLGPGSIVVPDRNYYEKCIKPSLNYILRGTIAHLSRMCGKKYRVIGITDKVVNLIPLRKASPLYKQGKGVLLIFESVTDIKNCLKVLDWDLPIGQVPDRT